MSVCMYVCIYTKKIIIYYNTGTLTTEGTVGAFVIIMDTPMECHPCQKSLCVNQDKK